MNFLFCVLALICNFWALLFMFFNAFCIMHEYMNLDN